MKNMLEEIKGFIYRKFPLARNKSINFEDSLLESGIIDSLGVLEIVSYLIETHGIEIDEDDLMPENFDSILSITKFIERKRNA